MPARALREHVVELLACIETAGYAVRAASTLRLRVGALVCAAVVARACRYFESSGYAVRVARTLRLRVGALVCAAVVARACRCFESSVYAVRVARTLRLRVGALVCAAVVARARADALSPASTLCAWPGR